MTVHNPVQAVEVDQQNEMVHQVKKDNDCDDSLSPEPKGDQSTLTTSTMASPSGIMTESLATTDQWQQYAENVTEDFSAAVKYESRSRDSDSRRKRKKEKKEKKREKKEKKKKKKEKKRKYHDSSASSDSDSDYNGSKKRKRDRSGWDEYMPNVPGTIGGAVGPVVGLPMLGVASAYPDSFANRRARELYVGGLQAGHANRVNVRDFFSSLLNQLPEFEAKYGSHPTYQGAVKEITISDGSFAFVEFYTEELAATVIEFDGVIFGGRALKIGRPAKFVPTGPLAPPLDVSPLRAGGVIPPKIGGSTQYGIAMRPGMQAVQPMMFQMMQAPSLVNNMAAGICTGSPGSPTTLLCSKPPPSAAKKQRELYVGNLQSGLCNEQALRELFTPACEMLPEYQAALGPPITCVDVRGGGTFAFVEFQNETVATAALAIFDKMDVGGRQINVGRPSGYVDPSGRQEAAPVPPPPSGPPPPPPNTIPQLIPQPPMMMMVKPEMMLIPAPQAAPVENLDMNAGANAALRLLTQ